MEYVRRTDAVSRHRGTDLVILGRTSSNEFPTTSRQLSGFAAGTAITDTRFELPEMVTARPRRSQRWSDKTVTSVPGRIPFSPCVHAPAGSHVHGHGPDARMHGRTAPGGRRVYMSLSAFLCVSMNLYNYSLRGPQMSQYSQHSQRSHGTARHDTTFYVRERRLHRLAHQLPSADPISPPMSRPTPQRFGRSSTRTDNVNVWIYVQ
jgi:hypothetical protein